MTMIEIIKDTFSFNKNLEHLFLFVDGERLDQLICRLLADKSYLDLMPSWLDYYPDGQDYQRAREYVWRQSRLDDGVKQLPILICPDDLDFSCTTIVVEVVPEEDRVIWNRFGLDTTGHPSYIGESVRWLPGIGPFEFKKSDYLSCMEALNNYPHPRVVDYKCVNNSKGLYSKLKKSIRAWISKKTVQVTQEPDKLIERPAEVGNGSGGRWKQTRFLHVGGLVDMGFDPTERYLLVASCNGLGLFDLTDGARVARDDDFVLGYADPDTGTVEGIGLLEGRRVLMFGIFGHPVSKKLMIEAQPLEHGVTELKSVLRTADGRTLVLGHSDGAYIFERQEN